MLYLYNSAFLEGGTFRAGHWLEQPLHLFKMLVIRIRINNAWRVSSSSYSNMALVSMLPPT